MRWVLALTGGIGSGKTAVSDRLASLGAEVIDTDRIAHQLSGPGQPGAQAVARCFGMDYLDAEGAIDRAKLRHKVFADATARQQLEQALHPLINQEARRQLAASQAAYQVLVVPLLFETGSYRDLYQRVLVVDCPESLQIARVMARSGISADEVRRIMARQLDRQQRLAGADDIVVNAGSLDDLLAAVDVLHARYLQLAASAAKFEPEH